MANIYPSHFQLCSCFTWNSAAASISAQLWLQLLVRGKLSHLACNVPNVGRFCQVRIRHPSSGKVSFISKRMTLPPSRPLHKKKIKKQWKWIICPQVWRPHTSCIHSWVLLGASGTWKPQVIVLRLFFTAVENVNLNFSYYCSFKVSWYWRSGWDGQGILVRPKDGLLGWNHCWLNTCYWSNISRSFFV